MCISPVTGTLRRAAGSPSCGSSTSATPRTQWTLWTARCLTVGSSGCRWPATDDHRTPCTPAEGLRHADTEEGTADAEAGAAQAALVAADGAAAAPGAEAIPDPGAATTTVAPGPTPIPDQDPNPNPSPSPSPGPPDGARQSLPPGLGPPSQEVEPRLPTEGPNPGPAPNPRVGLNLQKTTEQRLNPASDTT